MKFYHFYILFFVSGHFAKAWKLCPILKSSNSMTNYVESIYDISHSLSPSPDMLRQVDVIYIDLSKAFDSLLISKLQLYGINHNFLLVLRLYLSDRFVSQSNLCCAKIKSRRVQFFRSCKIVLYIPWLVEDLNHTKE